MVFSYDLIFAQVEIPDSPIDLEADVVSSTQIDLSWSKYDDTDISITGYKIETRINTDSDYSVVVEDTGSVDTKYSHTSLTPNTVYAYKVSAINSAGVSESSSTVTEKTPGNDSSGSDTDIEYTDIPTDVAVRVTSSTSVELTWDPPTHTYGQTIQSYTVKEELASDVYEDVATASGSDTKYTISNLSADKTYVFVIVANYELGSSDISKEVRATLNSSDTDDNTDNDDTDNNNTSEPDDVPDRPDDLEADVVSSTQIDLSWKAPDDDDNNNAGVNGYKIEVQKEGDSYETVVEDTKSTSTTYSHTDLDADTNYTYKVYSINSKGESTRAESASAKTLSSDDDNTSEPDDVPDRPDDLEADVVSSTQIDLSWKAPDDDDNNNAGVNGYKIEVQKEGDSYETVVEDTKSTSTTYSHTDLDADTNYTYKVYSINSKGESTRAESASAKTLSSDDDENNNTSQQNSSTSDNTSQQNSSTSDNTSQQNSSTSDNTSQQNSSTSDNTSQQNSST
ncbi:MAG: fibronectin type III domain-containing protein, partial [Nitrosopumilus sp.]|nr:fibronectin type III domain-containing protein [Nitrosopumilus sp.]